MKLTSFLSVALVAMTASADSLNVPSLISQYYPTRTPDINAAQSTSLASALQSQQSSWHGSPQYTSVVNAIYSAAPASASSSLRASGYRDREITAQSWYTKNVPQAQQTALASEINAFQSVANKIIGTPSTSTNGAMRTAAPVMAAAGVVGGFLAAL